MMRGWVEGRRRRVMALGAGAMVVVSVVGGPYFAAYQATRAAEHSQSAQQQVRALADTEAGVKSLLQYVAKAQTSTETQDLVAYLVAELEALCKATRGCVAAPVPGTLGGG